MTTQNSRKATQRLIMIGAIGLAASAACQPSPTPTPHVPKASPSARHLPADIRSVVTSVDAELGKEWANSGLKATPRADDATFVRRAYLDLTGAIPSSAQARRFVLDRSRDKRERLVSQLVASKPAAAHWAGYWDDVLMGDGRRNGLVDRITFRKWLHGVFRRNEGWDRIVHQLVAATGQNSQGGRRNPMQWDLSQHQPDQDPAHVNGAVNWLLRSVRQPQDIAGATSRVFLGVQIQCAECHDHKTEKWKQEDFKRFTAAFMRSVPRRMDRGRVMGIRRVELRNVMHAGRRIRARNKRLGYSSDNPRALDGTELDRGDKHPREALADWLTSRQNPWFAKAYVNRMWGYFLGTGFVEPVDDFREGQTPAAPKVLAALTKDFIEHNFDTRRLMRVIMASSAYQRAAGPNPKLWSQFALRPMSSDQLLDSLVVASRLEPVLEEIVGDRIARIKLRLRRAFRFTFDVDEAGDSDVFTGTVPQALMLLNGALTSAGSSALEGSTIATAVRSKDDAAAIEQLYYSALSRKPQSDEAKFWLARLANPDTSRVKPTRPRDVAPGNGNRMVANVYRRMQLDNVGPREHALEDMLWVLLNSSEFFFIH